MTVIGHTITSLNAVRKTIYAKRIDVNSSPKITGVKEREIDISGMANKQAVLSISFEFMTDYKPEVGSIKIEGDVIYIGTDNKKVLKEWEKSKQLPQEVDIEVKNFILRKCLLLGVNISQEMQLPPPLVVPLLRAKKEQEPNYIG